MSNEEQKRIFSKNLNRYISKSGKQQKEIAEAIGVNATTFNMWCTGNSMPGTGKLGTLAKYFRIGLSDLVIEKIPQEPDNKTEKMDAIASCLKRRSMVSFACWTIVSPLIINDKVETRVTSLNIGIL